MNSFKSLPAVLLLLSRASAWLEPPPGNVADSTIEDCTNWVLADGTQTCESIAEDYNISLEQSLQYNPDLKADNCALIHNQAYCVEKNYGNDDETEPQPEVVVQPIVADPPTTLIVLPSPNANYNPIAQPQAQPAQPAQPKAPGPVQPGQIATCNRWDLVKPGDGCYTFIQKYPGVTMELLYKWNPAIGQNCQSMWAHYYICTGVQEEEPQQQEAQPAAPAAPTDAADAQPAAPTEAAEAPIVTPQPTQGGMIQGCKKFHFVQPGEFCWVICQMYGIDFQDFYKWNPAVGANCEAMWANIYVY